RPSERRKYEWPNLCSPLTRRAEKRRSLCLHDAPYRGAVTGRTRLSLAVVDTVGVLIASGLVECIAIGSIGKGRAFVANGFCQNRQDAGAHPLDLISFQPFGPAARMNARQVQDLA